MEKIKEIKIFEEISERDGLISWELKIEADKNKIFNGFMYDGTSFDTPEDLTLSRDLNFLIDLKDILLFMYNAGKRGVKLEVNSENTED